MNHFTISSFGTPKVVYFSPFSELPTQTKPAHFGIFAVQSLNCVQLFATPWTTAYQGPLSSAISWSLLKFLSIELVMTSNHLILCLPNLLLLLQSFLASGSFPMSWLFTAGGQSIGVSKYIPRGIKRRVSKQYLYTHVHSSSNHSS